MKKSLLTLSLTALLVLCAVSLRAEFVTLTAAQGVNSNGVDQLSIEAYQLAEVVAFPASINGNTLDITKDGKMFTYARSQNFNGGPLDQCVVAGPATLKLRGGFCTVKITPESFPPDKTIVVLPGTGGATVTMECSTNLLSWVTATNGVYTNLNEAKFFRIRVDRIPPAKSRRPVGFLNVQKFTTFDGNEVQTRGGWRIQKRGQFVIVTDEFLRQVSIHYDNV